MKTKTCLFVCILLLNQNIYADTANCINSIADNTEYCYTAIPECWNNDCKHYGKFSISKDGKTETIDMVQAPFLQNKNDKAPAITQYYLHECSGDACKGQDYFLALWGDNSGSHETGHFFNPKNKSFTDLDFGWSGKTNLKKIDTSLYVAIQENRLYSTNIFHNSYYPVYFELYFDGNNINVSSNYNQRAEKFYLQEIENSLRKHQAQTVDDEYQGYYLFRAFIIAHRIREYNPEIYAKLTDTLKEFCNHRAACQANIKYFMRDLSELDKQ